MSGSDSSGSSNGPWGGSSAGGCEDLRLDRFLEAPVPGAVDALSVGDVLDVILREEEPPLVVAVDETGQEVGGILPTGQLIECLRRGFRFEAQVKDLNGGAVRIEVRAAA
jgi:hypothetical protein